MLNIIYGDMFKSGAKVLGHGTNAFGVMGSGIAVQFRISFPKMYQAYKKYCEKNCGTETERWLDAIAKRADRSGSPLEGTCWLWRNPSKSKQDIACLFTQHGMAADMGLIESSLNDLKTQMLAADLGSIALPAIGCGVAKRPGVTLEKVQALVEKTFDGTTIEPTMYLL